jgi:hypothetical protein
LISGEAYLPAASGLRFDVADGARVMPVNDVVRLVAAPSQYVIVGLGQDQPTRASGCWREASTPMRSLGAPARPVDADRAVTQPDPTIYQGMVADLMQAAAAAESLDDLFYLLEDASIMLRIDQAVTPTMARPPTPAIWELEQRRSIENVVRMGYIRRSAAAGSTSRRDRSQSGTTR